MKQYSITLNGATTTVEADKLQQVGEYVTFYTNSEVTGLVRLACGDSVFANLNDDPMAVNSRPGCSNVAGKHRT